jgi:hypothetical protein
MVRKKPCHMPCSTAGKAHTVPSKKHMYSFRPVTVEVARAKIEELGLAVPVEPFQHPSLGICYATETHVLTDAPATLPENVVDPVAVCKAAYMRFSSHACTHALRHCNAHALNTRAAYMRCVQLACFVPLNNQEALKAEPLMAEPEAEAAGDEVGLPNLHTLVFAQVRGLDVATNATNATSHKCDEWNENQAL